MTTRIHRSSSGHLKTSIEEPEVSADPSACGALLVGREVRRSGPIRLAPLVTLLGEESS